jgi:hypothetical protein
MLGSKSIVTYFKIDRELKGWCERIDKSCGDLLKGCKIQDPILLKNGF